MIAHSYYQNASDIRKNWSVTIDSVVHDRPAFISRTHDYLALLDSKLLSEILKGYKYHIRLDKEDDESYTGYVEELELVENSPTKEECLKSMVSAMKDYAVDYYAEFNYWSKAPNRAPHIPYVIKLLVSSDEMIMEDMICQDGEN